ncbi:MAG TPA: maltotransferase domain-containing protein, partial [Lacipirellulaceae bacterium]|nr:maltotransferase domain-containing protein [Lacipirellulaceae bacterium]
MSELRSPTSCLLSTPTPGVLSDGRCRVVVENVEPRVDGGRFPIKRVVGDRVIVEADVFADGHDAVAVELLYQCNDDAQWSRTRMRPLVNDRWTAEFKVERLGQYRYGVRGWVDHFATWKHGLAKRMKADQDIAVELLVGADMIRDAASRAEEPDRERLLQYESRLRSNDQPRPNWITDDEVLSQLMSRWYAPVAIGESRQYAVTVDRPRASFSAWYEMFPRSAANVHSPPGSGEGQGAGQRRHGTLKDVEARLPYVASMGFDVLYLPPIHPIGSSYRKGPNNSPAAGPEDVGSPWGIGSDEGGHK